MNVLLESAEDVLKVAHVGAAVLAFLGRKKGHDVASCACGLCAGSKLLTETSTRLEKEIEKGG